MPAKKAAPKSAKAKKPASRPPARKVAARKPEPAARPRPVSAQVRKVAPAAPTKKPAGAAPAAETELKKPLPRAAAPAATPVTATAIARASSAPGEGDDGDTIEPGSLLAGPRNVQPYIVKRGELYMSKEQLEHFRTILNNWKRDLMEEVDRTVSHMKDEAANFPDPNDRATQEEEFSLELRTRDRERKLIRKIDEALKRIEDGSYGYCLETGEEIGIKRLEARPVATLSIEAQERRERRERQYGDRDDRYR
ncbi:MAG: RNA polymerase-binding protein DksA [Proteobacteria bacterium]|nr:RNA polymerase-binding protein DksA [Pseudomonadota bacterium]